MNTRDELAEVLAGHRWKGAGPSGDCSCGWSGDWTRGKVGEQQRTHLADVILALDALTRMLADAWVEGYIYALDDDPRALAANPYRTTHQLDATEQRENQ